jgi:hypothetical protein
METNIEFNFGYRDSIRAVLFQKKIGFNVYDNERKMVIYRPLKKVQQLIGHLSDGWNLVKA